MPIRPTTLRDHLVTLRRRRVLILLMIVLGCGASVLFSANQEELYRGEASLSFREPTQDVELIGVAPVRVSTPEALAAVGAEFANGRDVLAAVKKRLRLRESINTLDDEVDARAEVRTNLVIIEVENNDPRRAAAIANAVAREAVREARKDQRRRYDQLIRATRREADRLDGDGPIRTAQRREYEQRIIQIRTTRDITRPAVVTESASVPSDPVSPKPVRNAGIGIAVGLLLGAILAFLLESLDRRLRSVQEITEQAGLPLLGSVRRDALGRVAVGSLNGRDKDAELDLEAFRIVRTNLDYLDVDAPPRKILVTSAMPEEGKSTVASSLAVAAALGGRRVLVLECDMRRPVLAGRFGADDGPGLSDYLAGHATPQEVVRAVELPVSRPAGDGAEPGASAPTLALLPAGTPSSRPAELLGSQRFEQLLAQVSEVYDLVIVDSPPLLVVGDALELVERVDTVLLCVRAGQTTREQLSSASAALGRLPDRPAGVVVTGTVPGEDDYGYYSYAYEPR